MPREPARQIIGSRQVRHDALLKSRVCGVCVHQVPFPPPSQRSPEDIAHTDHPPPRQGGVARAPSSETETVTYTLLFPPHFFLPDREFSSATPSLRAETSTPGNTGDGTTPQSRGMHVRTYKEAGLCWLYPDYFRDCSIPPPLSAASRCWPSRCHWHG